MCDPIAAHAVLAQDAKTEAFFIDPLTDMPVLRTPGDGGKQVWRFYTPLSLSAGGAELGSLVLHHTLWAITSDGRVHPAPARRPNTCGGATALTKPQPLSTNSLIGRPVVGHLHGGGPTSRGRLRPPGGPPRSVERCLRAVARVQVGERPRCRGASGGASCVHPRGIGLGARAVHHACGRRSATAMVGRTALYSCKPGVPEWSSERGACSRVGPGRVA